MCFEHAARVPRRFMRWFEDDHRTRDGGPKRLPSKLSIKRKMGGLPRMKFTSALLLYHSGHLDSANQPSPNPLRRRANRNLIARVHDELSGSNPAIHFIATITPFMLPTK